MEPRLSVPSARQQPRNGLWVLVLLWLCGCASLDTLFGAAAPDLPSRRAGADEVAAQLERAGLEIESGRFVEASERCLRLREVKNLPSDLREQSELLLERATLAHVSAASSAEELERPSAGRLPRRSRAIATIGRAHLLVAEGRPYRAFTEVRNLEAVHPGHHLQNEAAEVIYEAGLALSQAKPTFLLLFSSRAQAPGVLDYLVLQHPSYSRCDHAYYLLASLHAENREIDLAIDRLSDLLLYHSNSPYAREAELLIPTLRLADQLRFDYDRAGQAMSERELTSWMGHSSSGEDPALVERAQEALGETRWRMIQADLKVARFYRTVRRPEGTERYARRALAIAQGLGAEESAQEARSLLAWAGSNAGVRELPPEFRRTTPEAPEADELNKPPRDAQTPDEAVIGAGP